MPRRVAGRAVRTMGRTAVIAGTATAVSGRVARKQQQRYAAEQTAAAPPPQQYAAPAPPSPPVAPAADPYEELKKLAELKDAGILTQEEFNAKKAQILGL